MEFALLGWPPDGPTLRLNHRRFAYAGKFVMSTTGKAVVRDTGWENEAGGDEAGSDRTDGDETDGDETDGDVTGDTERRRESDGRPTAEPDGTAYDTDIGAAVAFNADRTDDRRLRLRYITVRSDLKGEGIGPRLAAFVAARAERQGYTRVAIAVNNPFAYEAMYKAGFEWTGRESGVAELVLERPAGALADDGAAPEPYRAGLDRYRDRDLGDPEASFLADRADADPPAPVGDPDGVGPDNPDA